jgi:hypothetical protein
VFAPFSRLPVPPVTIVIHHRQVVVERGSVVPDPSQSSTDESIPGCLIAPVASSDTLQPRQGVSAKWALYVPPNGVPISPSDLVSLPGIETKYRIVGIPACWPNPDGGYPYRVIQLIDQEG